ncbi:SUR7 protein [Drepanopeziza brunnea f. sp. 'multigermtubi' MB_m1]|uniref:SUR7 protein n=1 Tax=Marssonina brunnea f. sp. multigermtubi (strain MB_m1) TaxID=1072389 RepID=K1X3R0_MARBU|nr:SUR7 protein [Drepanopeziza brunnea f. sp. 'multigermtubi' MB_m1]EKD15368.1 SUR7 protein [Drepanopeziza brunnea f. sp. 'multigermtubi' MB_m1]
MRVIALFPLACAIVGFILSLLALLAGSEKSFMEDYHIITLNTSTLGHNVFGSDSDATPTSTSASATASATSTVGRIGNFITGVTDNVTDRVEDEFNELVADVANNLAAELGINQWYSLHMLNWCQGNYKPNATAEGASKNITSCTNRTAFLSDINWPDDINRGLDALNAAFNAVFILYAIGIAAAGLAIIGSAAAFFLEDSRLISFGNCGLASLSFSALCITSSLVTYVQTKAVNIINKYGNAVGAYADRGGKYMAITWVAVVVMFLAAITWVVDFFIGRRNQTREYTEKPHTRRIWGRSRHSDEAQLRRAGV